MTSPFSHKHSQPERGVGTGQNYAIRQAVFARVMKSHFRLTNGFVKRKIHKIGDILLTAPQNIVVIGICGFKKKLS